MEHNRNRAHAAHGAEEQASSMVQLDIDSLDAVTGGIEIDKIPLTMRRSFLNETFGDKSSGGVPFGFQAGRRD